MSSEMYGPEHFTQFMPRDGGLLDAIERESLERGIPIVGPSVGVLLTVLVRTTKARRVLELGTANGYSTIFMARALPEGGRIDTMEWSPELAAEARVNFQRAGVKGRIEIHVGDALKMLKDLEPESFDLVFMDIEKEMYSAALEDCVRVLETGGLLVCDNVAFRSSGDFNERLSQHPRLETSFLYGTFFHHSPDQDALSLSVKV